MNRAGIAFYATDPTTTVTISFARTVKNGCVLGIGCGLSDQVPVCLACVSGGQQIGHAT